MIKHSMNLSTVCNNIPSGSEISNAPIFFSHSSTPTTLMIVFLTTLNITFSGYVPHPNEYCYEEQKGDTIERICLQESPHD